MTRSGPTAAEIAGVLANRTPVELARELLTLRTATRAHIGYAHDPTGERVDVYAPNMRCLELAILDADMVVVLHSLADIKHERGNSKDDDATDAGN